MDGDMDFSHNLMLAGMNQLHIPDKPAGKGILHRNHYGIHLGRIVGSQHLLKAVIAHDVQRFTPIKSQGSLLMETASLS